jgi:hypothetical protein
LLNSLSEYKYNNYSQNGEDGILEEILKRLGDFGVSLDKYCCEFGAWDGIFYSNTYNLVKNLGYNAVLIEGDQNKYKTLQKNFQSSNHFLLNKFVGLTEESNLDNLLKSTLIPHKFDILSIDIDGQDYWILESLQDYIPKIILIEYNPTIPMEVEYFEPKNSELKTGSSVLALVSLANRKNYSLVATTDTNLILLRNDLNEILTPAIEQNEVLKECKSLNLISNYFFIGYDGNIHFSHPIRLPWHDLVIPARNSQFLPKFLRKFPSDYNSLQAVSLRLLRLAFGLRIYGLNWVLKKISTRFRTNF